jgi:hypothetical protein
MAREIRLRRSPANVRAIPAQEKENDISVYLDTAFENFI